jgi:hypothetical protein
MYPKKVQKIVPWPLWKKRGKGMNSASMLSFFMKNIYLIKWHVNCIYFSKSDTLISFLLKKVYFVPQSRPFSIMAICKCSPDVPVAC